MPAPATPIPTPETAPYWEAAARGELSLPRCLDCGAYVFYPRSFCPVCRSRRLEWVACSGDATLESFIVNRRPAPGFEDVSPVIALVRLAEGPVLTTTIVGVEPDPDALSLDMPLHVAFEPRGDVVVPVFAPVAPVPEEAGA